MSEIFAVETPGGTAGLAVRAETGFRFYASNHAFAALESRRYRRVAEIQTEIDRLAATLPRPVATRQRGNSKRRST